MFETMLPAVIGAAGIAGAYVAYLATTKGVPYVWNGAKSWWTAGAAELATIKGDVASAHSKIAALETKLVGIVGPVAALQTDVGSIKTKVGL